ncbi:MAG: hypothetical protein WCJ95_17450 [Mariniphaga sp.]
MKTASVKPESQIYVKLTIVNLDFLKEVVTLIARDGIAPPDILHSVMDSLEEPTMLLPAIIDPKQINYN